MLLYARPVRQPSRPRGRHGLEDHRRSSPERHLGALRNGGAPPGGLPEHVPPAPAGAGRPAQRRDRRAPAGPGAGARVYRSWKRQPSLTCPPGSWSRCSSSSGPSPGRRSRPSPRRKSSAAGSGAGASHAPGRQAQDGGRGRGGRAAPLLAWSRLAKSCSLREVIQPERDYPRFDLARGALYELKTTAKDDAAKFPLALQRVRLKHAALDLGRPECSHSTALGPPTTRQSQDLPLEATGADPISHQTGRGHARIRALGQPRRTLMFPPAACRVVPGCKPKPLE